MFVQTRLFIPNPEEILFFSRIRKSASTIREVEGDGVVVVVVMVAVMVAGEVDMEAGEVGMGEGMTRIKGDMGAETMAVVSEEIM